MKKILICATLLFIITGNIIAENPRDYNYVASKALRKCVSANNHPTLGNISPLSLLQGSHCKGVKINQFSTDHIGVRCVGKPGFPSDTTFVYARTMTSCNDLLQELLGQ